MKYTKPTPNKRERKPRNKMIVSCPICKTDNSVFCWSFGGSGKKCQNCKFLMTSGNINKVLASGILNLGVPSSSFRLSGGFEN